VWGFRFQRGPNSNCRTREMGGDARCYRLNFHVLLALSSQLSVFLKLRIINTLLHFLLCQSSRSLRNVSFGSLHIPFLGLIKRSYHGWLSMMTSSASPFSALPWTAPPLSTHARSTDVIKWHWGPLHKNVKFEIIKIWTGCHWSVLCAQKQQRKR